MKVSFVSGKFKVLHSGHLRLFNTAAELSDKLVVAIDIVNLSESEIELRTNLIENLPVVDEVVTFKEDVSSILELIKPDYVIKGAEFSNIFNVEEEVVKRFNGKLVFSSGTYFQSESQQENSHLNFIRHSNDFLERRNITNLDILDIINGFKELNVCVIGDLIVDEYVECKPLGLSQEQPTLVVAPVESREYVGGAGIVSAHCSSLGAKTHFITSCEFDSTSEWALAKLSEYGIKTHFVKDPLRRVIKKVRYMVGNQILFRINHVPTKIITKENENRVLSSFLEVVNEVNLVIISDFSYGLLTDRMVNEIIQICKNKNIYIAADCQSSSQIGNLEKYMNCNLITATEREARLAIRDEISGLAVLAENLRNKLSAENVILKLGADGLIIQSYDFASSKVRETEEIPALNIDPVDISGAGDSLLAATSMAQALGGNIFLSTYIGSLVAAIQISREGNLPVPISALNEILP